MLRWLLPQCADAVQAMAQAEAAYVRVMRTASHVNLSGDCDGPAMRAAMQRFSDLPYILSEVCCLPPARHRQCNSHRELACLCS